MYGLKWFSKPLKSKIIVHNSPINLNSLLLDGNCTKLEDKNLSKKFSAETEIHKIDSW
jgi:hypothetical protein